jgi:hypothetical protein
MSPSPPPSDRIGESPSPPLRDAGRDGGPTHKDFHPFINGEKLCINSVNIFNINHTGMPCDEDGNYLPPNTVPPPFVDPPPDDWFPFSSRIEFETAEFLYKRNQMSGGDIDTLFELWGASLAESGGVPPFSNHKDLYNAIDSAKVGDVQWQNFTVHYDGPLPDVAPPSWMTKNFDVWYRDPHEVIKMMLGNTDFNGEMDNAPFREYDADGDRRYQNLMSGDWSWQQAVSSV